MTSRPSSPMLRDLAGLSTDPTPLAESTLLVIDAQVEYSACGALLLSDIDAALVRVGELLAEARRREVPVIHVAHLGAPDGLFDPKNGGRFLVEATPLAAEEVVNKTLPNAFAGTARHSQRSLIVSAWAHRRAHSSTLAHEASNHPNHPKENTMSTEITVKSTPAVVVAAHRTATTHAEVFNDIPAGFATVMAALNEADTSPAGIPFTLYHQAPDGDTAGDIAMCVPIATTIDTAADGVETIELAAETAVSVLHRGSYDDIGRSYAEIASWIQERGHRIAGPSREVYLNSPGEVADDDLLTEIHFPIEAEGER